VVPSPGKSTIRATGLSLVLVATALAGCVAGDDGTETAGFDLGEPGAPPTSCADYPGGSRSGDDPLVLVNKEPDQQLRRDWAPSELASIDAAMMMPGREGELYPSVLDAMEEMFAAASADGLTLGVRSAYRSFMTQCYTFQAKVEEHGLDHAKRFSAEPGRSQHQLGTTADITSENLGWALAQSMGGSAEGQWLAENAHRFGFALSYPAGEEEATGYAYEPWHYRYIGRDAAAEMTEAGLILEEYLQACQAGDPNLRCERETL
jgi:D-alanyl-D-alanine carboxypeptidase